MSKLIRVRSNLCLYGIPEPYSGRGRPKKHGAKWKLNQCSDFPRTDEVLEMEDPSLGQIRMSKWCQYSRRFGVDHWYRFAKHRRPWTLPNFRTPVQCQRWSELIVNISWQLWLSKADR